jgi:uncharacterized protein
MSFSLHAATVSPMLQVLGSVTQLVHKAEAYCAEQGVTERDIIAARLAPDMLPFTYQVKSTAEHSLGAINAVREGFATPSLEAPPKTFAALLEKLAVTREGLAALTPAEVNGFIGKDVVFEFKGVRREFVAENFLMSYALPNFYFHAVTAYDLLRARGLAIGKKDFMGVLAVKG